MDFRGTSCGLPKNKLWTSEEQVVDFRRTSCGLSKNKFFNRSSLWRMAVRLRGGVVIPTRLSMHVATAKTVTETVTAARAHAAAARLCLAFSPQQTNSNTPFAPSPPTRLSARAAAPDTTRARQGPHRCRRNMASSAPDAACSAGCAPVFELLRRQLMAC